MLVGLDDLVVLVQKKRAGSGATASKDVDRRSARALAPNNKGRATASTRARAVGPALSGSDARLPMR